MKGTVVFLNPVTPWNGSPGQGSPELLQQFRHSHGGHGRHGHSWHGDVLEDGLGDHAAGGPSLVEGLDHLLLGIPTGIPTHHQQGHYVILPEEGERWGWTHRQRDNDIDRLKGYPMQE